MRVKGTKKKNKTDRQNSTRKTRLEQKTNCKNGFFPAPLISFCEA